MKLVKNTFYIVATLATALILTGCGGGSGDKKDAAKPEVLTMVTAAVKGLDGVRATDTASFGIITNVQETLLTSNNDIPVPAAAKSFEVSQDGKTYTFHLRDGLKWSDGKPLTSKDFLFSWRRLIDPNVGASYASFLFQVKNAKAYYEKKGNIKVEDIGISAPDDKTFVVELINPVPYFKQIAAFPALAPQRADMVEKYGETYGSKADKVLYSGPYMVTTWQKGAKVILTKNPNYWNAKNITVENIKMLEVKEFSTQYQMFRDGQLDVIAGNTGEYIEKLKQGVKEGKWQLKHVVAPIVFYIEYNFKTNKALLSQKVRTALSMSIDRETFTKKVLKNHVPAYSLVPKGIMVGDIDYRSKVPEQLKGVKIADVKALLIEGLKEQGLDPDPDKVTLRFLLQRNTADAKTQGEFLKNEWEKKLGIHVSIEPSADFSDFLRKQHNGDYDMAFSGWGADYNSPMSFLDLYTTWNGNNTGKYNNPAVDPLVTAVAAQSDLAKRVAMYKQLEDIYVVSDPSMAPVYFKELNSFQKNFIKGLQFTNFGGTFQFRYITFEAPAKK